MHITEGIITGTAAVAYTGAGVGLVGLGVKRMKKFVDDFPEKKPVLGMAGAIIFFISLIPIPAFTGTCSHPCGTPFVGILLGPLIGTALAGISLFLQAAFFAHGGFGTWGANVVALGFMGCFFGWASFRAARKMGASILIAGCIGGLIGDIMVYATSGFILGTTLTMAPAAQYSLTGYLLVIYSAYLPTQLPIAVGEMLITGFALSYAYKQRPEVLESFGVVKKQPASPAVSRVVLLAVIVFLSALICLTPKTAVSADEAASAPVAETAGEASAFSGMDEAVNENLAETAGLPPRAPYIDTESMGDLWNAIMLLAGGICGFVLGRWSHIIWGSGKRDENPKYMSPRENIHEYQT